MGPVVDVRDLRKYYKVSVKRPGIGASLRSLIRPQREERRAVNGLSFGIAAGEIVGLLGRNGAGKTTTMKMLSGILYPTSGDCTVLGHTPWDRKRAFQQRISMITGQKNTLWWDLPAADSFLLNKEIYDIPDPQYRDTIGTLSELLDVKHLMHTPVRHLSLGERMKMELIAGLLHRPSVLFLDEPTIGLDLPSQRSIREFVQSLNSLHNTTVLLTSHYMNDVEQLCSRIIIIDNGCMLYDGQLSEVIERFSDTKTLTLTLEHPVSSDVFEDMGQVTGGDRLHATILVPRHQVARVIARLAALPIADVTIQEAPIERVIEHMLSESSRDMVGV